MSTNVILTIGIPLCQRDVVNSANTHPSLNFDETMFLSMMFYDAKLSLQWGH